MGPLKCPGESWTVSSVFVFLLLLGFVFAFVGCVQSAIWGLSFSACSTRFKLRTLSWISSSLGFHRNADHDFEDELDNVHEEAELWCFWLGEVNLSKGVQGRGLRLRSEKLRQIVGLLWKFGIGTSKSVCRVTIASKQKELLSESTQTMCDVKYPQYGVEELVRSSSSPGDFSTDGGWRFPQKTVVVWYGVVRYGMVCLVWYVWCG